jgi:hypothetical protein
LTRLLCVNQRHINRSWRSDGCFDGGFCYFMEYNPFGCLYREIEYLTQMPGDSLAFTVVVCGENDLIGGGNRRAEFRDLALLGRHHGELGLEFVVDINGFQTVFNLSDMPKTGETYILIFTEVGLDFLALGGGFDDNEGATGGDGGGGGGGGGGRCLVTIFIRSAKGTAATATTAEPATSAAASTTPTDFEFRRHRYNETETYGV